MPGFFQWSGWPILKNIGWNLGLLILGSLLCALAINGIIIPHRFETVSRWVRGNGNSNALTKKY